MGDVVRSVEPGPDDGDPATRHALPPGAHARRASRPSLAQGSATAESAPQVSQAIATATLREEEAESARQMIVIGRVIALAALVPLAFIGGSVALRIAMAVSVGIAVAVSGLIERGALAEMHDDVDLVLALALAKQPADRFASCREFRAALASAIDDRLDDALRTRARVLLDTYPWGTARAQPHHDRTLALG